MSNICFIRKLSEHIFHKEVWNRQCKESVESTTLICNILPFKLVISDLNSLPVSRLNQPDLASHTYPTMSFSKINNHIDKSLKPWDSAWLIQNNVSNSNANALKYNIGKNVLNRYKRDKIKLHTAVFAKSYTGKWK